MCGKVPPHVSALACAGSESSVTQCPMSTGDDVFCAPEESVALSCAGVGDPIGKICVSMKIAWEQPRLPIAS